MQRLQRLTIQLTSATTRLQSTKAADTASKMALSEKEWKERLTPKEFEVLRKKGTEPPRTGEYDKFYPKTGYFACKGCGNPLYTAKAKFDSGCGWPAFDKCVKGAIETHVDSSFFMKRIEIVCAKCGGHQGHVFEGEGFTETNERHCVNSISVKYINEPLPEEAAAKGEAKVT